MAAPCNGNCCGLVIYTPVYSERVYGKTTELTVKERANDSKIQMKAKLDLGKVIVILVDNNFEHLTGRKVEISKMASVAGMASYNLFSMLIQTYNRLPKHPQPAVLSPQSASFAASPLRAELCLPERCGAYK
jgi:tRNA A22 N-methylase